MADHFRALGLDRSASESEIKAKYRLLAKRHHPDLNPGCKVRPRARAPRRA